MQQKKGKEEKILKFNNPELDRRIGGIPLPSLTLIEGPNNSGKSVIVQQLSWSALNSGYNVVYITSEETPKGLISHMEELSWKVLDYYLIGQFRITALHIRGIKWNSEVSRFYLLGLQNFINRLIEKYKIFVIDSLTYLITYAIEQDILEFFSELRNLVDLKDATFFVTIHPYAVEEDMLIRIRSISDGHFLLSIKHFHNRNVMVLNVAKLRGASRTSDSIVSFDVDPVMGIKVLPFSFARA